MNSKQTKIQHDAHADDLSWLAFRYVAGELREVEASEFENRMAEDQSAREALADAVELSNSISISLDSNRILSPASLEPAGSAPQKPTVTLAPEQSYRPFRSPLFWATVAASVAVCLAVFNVARMHRLDQQLKQQLKRNQESSANSNLNESQTDVTTFTLAQAWTESHDLLNGESEIAQIEEDSDDIGQLIQEIHRDIYDDEIEFAPSWMIVGVSGNQLPKVEGVEELQEIQTP